MRPPNPLKGALSEIPVSPKVYGSASPALYALLKPEADRMRQNPTPAESVLWGALSGRKFGVKFRRQHIIDRFIVDFYAVDARLTVEADGEIHDSQKDRDQQRDNILRMLGVTVLRFKNREIIGDLESVVNRIKRSLYQLTRAPFRGLGAI